MHITNWIPPDLDVDVDANRDANLAGDDDDDAADDGVRRPLMALLLVVTVAGGLILACDYATQRLVCAAQITFEPC